MTTLEAAKYTHSSIVGSQDLSAGSTLEGLDIQSPENSTLKLVKQYPLGSIPSWIFWNPVQAELLAKPPSKVAFINDAGQGKTLLLKHMARKMCKIGLMVNYGSFSTIDSTWMPRNLSSFVDLAAEEEFKHFNQIELPRYPICTISAKDFQFAQLDSSNVTLFFKFITALVKKNPEKHFFIGKCHHVPYDST